MGIKVKFLGRLSNWGSDNITKYYLENREGIDICKNPLHGPRLVESSAESDIFNVLKEKLGTGNKIYSPKSYSNLLRWQGACIGKH